MFYGDAEETIAAIEEEKQPRVSVSLSELKRIELGDKQTYRWKARVYHDKVDEAKRVARLTPHYHVRSPYDQWEVRSYQVGRTNVSPLRNVDEDYEPAQLVEWLPYITTTFLQDTPGKFLEYLRLMQSTVGNPWVEPVFYGENTPANRFKWADPMTGQEHGVNGGYPPLVMYPHTITNNGELDLSITLDRFKEALIWDALGQSFTILDISRTTDPKFLDWAFKRVLNRAPYVKSQIAEESVVQLFRKGQLLKTTPVRINPQMQGMMQQAADDALVLIRQNRDKLAARVIEVKRLNAQGVDAEFIGPEWLNPLTPAKISDEEISRRMQVQSLAQAPSYNLPVSLMSKYTLPPIAQSIPDEVIEEVEAPVKKNNFLLPITGAAVAALGIYAATR